MSKDSYVALFVTTFVTLLGVAFAYVGSAGQPFADGLHLFALTTFLAFAIQWVAFVPAIILRNVVEFRAGPHCPNGER